MSARGRPDRNGAKVWIHADGADAASRATSKTTADQVVDEGVVSIHFSGHTKGHVVYRVDNRFLVAGDALPSNHRRNEVDFTTKR